MPGWKRHVPVTPSCSQTPRALRGDKSLDRVLFDEAERALKPVAGLLEGDITLAAERKVFKTRHADSERDS